MLRWGAYPNFSSNCLLQYSITTNTTSPYTQIGSRDKWNCSNKKINFPWNLPLSTHRIFLSGFPSYARILWERTKFHSMVGPVPYSSVYSARSWILQSSLSFDSGRIVFGVNTKEEVSRSSRLPKKVRQEENRLRIYKELQATVLSQLDGVSKKQTFTVLNEENSWSSCSIQRETDIKLILEGCQSSMNFNVKRDRKIPFKTTWSGTPDHHKYQVITRCVFVLQARVKRNRSDSRDNGVWDTLLTVQLCPLIIHENEKITAAGENPNKSPSITLLYFEFILSTLSVTRWQTLFLLGSQMVSFTMQDRFACARIWWLRSYTCHLSPRGKKKDLHLPHFATHNLHTWIQKCRPSPLMDTCKLNFMHHITEARAHTERDCRRKCSIWVRSAKSPISKLQFKNINDELEKPWIMQQYFPLQSVKSAMMTQPQMIRSRDEGWVLFLQEQRSYATGALLTKVGVVEDEKDIQSCQLIAEFNRSSFKYETTDNKDKDTNEITKTHFVPDWSSNTTDVLWESLTRSAASLRISASIV